MTSSVLTQNKTTRRQLLLFIFYIIIVCLLSNYQTFTNSLGSIENIAWNKPPYILAKGTEESIPYQRRLYQKNVKESQMDEDEDSQSSSLRQADHSLPRQKILSNKRNDPNDRGAESRQISLALDSKESSSTRRSRQDLALEEDSVVGEAKLEVSHSTLRGNTQLEQKQILSKNRQFLNEEDQKLETMQYQDNPILITTTKTSKLRPKSQSEESSSTIDVIRVKEVQSSVSQAKMTSSITLDTLETNSNHDRGNEHGQASIQEERIKEEFITEIESLEDNTILDKKDNYVKPNSLERKTINRSVETVGYRPDRNDIMENIVSDNGVATSLRRENENDISFDTRSVPKEVSLSQDVQNLNTRVTTQVEITEPKRPIMYTYYEPATTDMTEEADTDLLENWKKAWYDAGWEPYVLDESHARLLPQFEELVQLVIEPKHIGTYNMACYIRWMAMAAVGGGFMADYDTFPLNHFLRHGRKLPFDGELTVWAGHVPALVSGNGSEYLRVARRIGISMQKHVSEQMHINKYGPVEEYKQHIVWSDMLALAEIYKTSDYAFIKKHEVANAAEILQVSQWTKEHCFLTNSMRAIHFSHKAMELGKQAYRGAIHRATVARQFLNKWHAVCPYTLVKDYESKL